MNRVVSISLVLFNPDIAALKSTLDHLEISLSTAKIISSSLLYIIDNSETLNGDYLNHPSLNQIPHEIIHGHGNIGFGKAHNLILDKRLGDFHLILNPDVDIQPPSILNAISFMRNNPNCGLISPSAIYPDGQKQYLCKRYPSLVDLFLRGFLPTSLSVLFAKRLSHYEMREETNKNVYWDPLIVSGCFMFYRTSVFQQLKGFDPRYFLYFEDFDISIITKMYSSIAYAPNVTIIHSGGNAAKKGWWHIKQFILSSTIFFQTYGLQIW